MSVQVNGWHTATGRLHEATESGGNGPRESGTESPVRQESELVLTLQLTGVFPWDALRVGRVLAESVCYPGVALEVLLEPIDVLDLHLRCGNGRWAQLEDFISFFAGVVKRLIRSVIKDWLPEQVILCSIELAWHSFL